MESRCNSLDGLKQGLAKNAIPLILSVTIVAAAILRAHYFSGLGFSDDLEYSLDAFCIADGCFSHSRTLLQLRLGMLLPIAFFYKTLGVNEWALAAYSFLCSLGSIVLVYHLGKMLCNKWVGLLASCLLAFYPLDLEYATTASPDVPQSLFNGLAVYFFLAASMRFTRRGRGTAWAMALASGLLTGFSYLIRDTGALLGIFFALYLILDMLINRRSEVPLREQVKERSLLYGAFLAGFLIIFCIEGLYHYLDAGDFFLRYHVTSDYYSKDPCFFAYGVNQDFTYYVKMMFHLDDSWRFAADQPYYPYGFYFYALWPSLFYITLRRFEKGWPLALWFLFYYIFLQYGSMSLVKYFPVHRLDRHLFLTTLPGIVMLSMALYDLCSAAGKKGRWPGGLVIFIASSMVLFLTASSLHYASYSRELHRMLVHDAREAYRFLENYQAIPVYADNSTMAYFMFQSGYRNIWRFRPYADLYRVTAQKEKIIIMDSCRACRENPRSLGIPLLWSSPQKNWVLLKEIYGPECEIWREYNPRIYRVRQGSGE